MLSYGHFSVKIGTWVKNPTTEHAAFIERISKGIWILKLAQNIYTKHRNITKIYVHYTVSQATKKLKWCQHFLQTTPYMTHQSINYIIWTFSVHTGIRHRKPLNTVEMKRLEKNYKRSHNFKFTCRTHTKRMAILRSHTLQNLIHNFMQWDSFL